MSLHDEDVAFLGAYADAKTDGAKDMAPGSEVAPNTHFRRVGEVEVDARRRIALGQVGIRRHTRYLLSENDAGEILLTPVRSIPDREAVLWENPELRESLTRGMEQASLGRLEDRGNFAQYLDEDEKTI